MKDSMEKKTVDREELSKTFAICTCIGIMLCMALVLLLGGCSAAENGDVSKTAGTTASGAVTGGFVTKETAPTAPLTPFEEYNAQTTDILTVIREKSSKSFCEAMIEQVFDGTLPEVYKDGLPPMDELMLMAPMGKYEIPVLFLLPEEVFGYPYCTFVVPSNLPEAESWEDVQWFFNNEALVSGWQPFDVLIDETDAGWEVAFTSDTFSPSISLKTAITLNSADRPKFSTAPDGNKALVSYTDADSGENKLFVFSMLNYGLTPDRNADEGFLHYDLSAYPAVYDFYWESKDTINGKSEDSILQIKYPPTGDAAKDFTEYEIRSSVKGNGTFDPLTATLLGLPKSDNRMQYIEAFLNDDLEGLYALCDGYPDKHAFDMLCEIVIGNYEVFLEEDRYLGPLIYITLEILESDIAKIPAGVYERIPVESSINGCYLDFGYSRENWLDLTEEESVCTSYIRQFGLEMPTGIKDPTPLMNYLLGYVDNERVTRDAGTTIYAGLTKEDVDAIAMKLYGFTFEIPQNRLTESGEITCDYIPSGAVYFYNFTNMSADANRITATVEFYSDQSCIAVCRNVTYDFVLRDGMWIIESIDIEEVLPLEPFRGLSY